VVSLSIDEFLSLPKAPPARERPPIPHAIVGGPRKGTSRKGKAGRYDPNEYLGKGELDEDARRQCKADRKGWSNVRTGVIVVLVATLLTAFFLFMGLASVLARQGGQASEILQIGALVGGLATALGQAMCCSVPKRTGAKGWATLATVLSFTSGAIAVYLFVGKPEPSGPGTGITVFMVINLLYLVTGAVGTLLWCVFLCQAGARVGSTGLAVTAGIFTGLYLLLLLFLTYLFSTGGAGFSREAGQLLGFSILGLVLYYLGVLITAIVVFSLHIGKLQRRLEA
jgi:hypothetical protein